RRRQTRLVSDWSSDVCSSDLRFLVEVVASGDQTVGRQPSAGGDQEPARRLRGPRAAARERPAYLTGLGATSAIHAAGDRTINGRSEERRVGKGGRDQWAPCR